MTSDYSVWSLGGHPFFQTAPLCSYVFVARCWLFDPQIPFVEGDQVLGQKAIKKLAEVHFP